MEDFRDIEVKAGNHSFIITVIIGLLSLLLLLVTFSFDITKTQAAPIEIAMNFGNTDVGQGEEEPAPADELPASAASAASVESKTEAPTPTAPTRQAVTQHTAENRPVAAPQTTTKPKTSNKPENRPTESKPKGNQRANDALSSILSGKGQSNAGGQGNDGVAGNVGDPKGSASQGMGIGENWKSTIPEPQQHNCSSSGTIVVEIIVNSSGGIKSVTPGVRGSTSADPCLKTRARELVMQYVRAYPGADGRKGLYRVNLR
ncbi:hypothetical protein GO491_10230 [Flavobacteriaceae bacterium Ap0902]|nr:hypothetical protein [Flavobacteriaceae bacterium Ap0902]